MKKQLLESTPYEGLKDATHIDVEVHYRKGGVNFIGGTNRRGYYVSAKPVTHKNGMVSFTLFTGTAQLLMEADRYSAKQFEKAVEMGKQIAPDLINRVLEKEKSA